MSSVLQQSIVDLTIKLQWFWQWFTGISKRVASKMETCTVVFVPNAQWSWHEANLVVHESTDSVPSLWIFVMKRLLNTWISIYNVCMWSKYTTPTQYHRKADLLQIWTVDEVMHWWPTIMIVHLMGKFNIQHLTMSFIHCLLPPTGPHNRLRSLSNKTIPLVFILQRTVTKWLLFC